MKDLQEFERFLAHVGEGLGHALAAAYLRSLAQDAATMSVLPARKRKASLLTQ